MSYLIDTNALSELRAQRPDANVEAWFARQLPEALFLSALTLGEIRKGIEKLTASERKTKLSDWLDRELPSYFAGRILPIDAVVADRWGCLAASAGRTLPAVDSLLAATAIAHGLVLVTRNTRDFAGLPVTLLDPWLAT